MTVPSNTIQNVNRVGVREDLSNKIAELFPDDTPFLNAIGTGKCSATKTEWQTDGLANANANNAQIQGDDLANDARTNTTRVSTYTGVNNYAALVNGLTGKYGNEAASSTTTTSGLNNFLNSLSGLSSALGGGSGLLNGIQGILKPAPKPA